jgi:hypothetical protein
MVDLLKLDVAIAPTSLGCGRLWPREIPSGYLSGATPEICDCEQRRRYELCLNFSKFFQRILEFIPATGTLSVSAPVRKLETILEIERHRAIVSGQCASQVPKAQ